MDKDSLVRQILNIIRGHGFPENRVRLPFQKVYRTAVDNGFSLDAVLETLQKVHQVAAEREEDKLVFSRYSRPMPLVSSKTVDKSIRGFLRPILEDAGFARHSGRTSWHCTDETIGVVALHSFNAYYAELYRCTTISLAITVGLYYKCVHKCPWVSGEPPEFPKEAMCHLRLSPAKSTDYRDECESRNIWYIRTDGSNITDAVEDIGRVLVARALPWIEAHRNVDSVLHRFLNTEPAEDEVYFGMPFSPARANVVCGVYLARGQVELARAHLAQARGKESSPATAKLLREYVDSFHTAYPGKA